jgi:hypothetical protein
MRVPHKKVAKGAFIYGASCYTPVSRLSSNQLAPLPNDSYGFNERIRESQIYNQIYKPLLSGETGLCLCRQGHVVAQGASLPLSAVAEHALRQVRGGGGRCAELLRQSHQVSTMHYGEEPPEPARRRLRGTLPATRRQRRLGRCALHQDSPGHQCQFRQPLPAFGSKDELPRCPHHVLGRQGQPFPRPALAIEGLQGGARQW